MPPAAQFVGRVFGHLTVLRETGRKHGEVLWHCVCDCPAQTVVLATSRALRRGDTRHCGCAHARKIDLTGRVFGRLTVLRESDSAVQRSQDTLWLCQCSCAAETLVNASSYALRHGRKVSCGCYRREVVRAAVALRRRPRVRDLTGRVFGRLTVLGLAGFNARQCSEWVCACACEEGVFCTASGEALVRGQKRSCGCLQHEASTRKGPRIPRDISDLLPYIRADVFWSKVDKGAPDACWLWKAGVSSEGYGQHNVWQKKQRRCATVAAHRVAYLLTHGRLTPGMWVLHNCEARYPHGDCTGRRCVNPRHLYEGTLENNAQDRVRSGRGAFGDRHSSRIAPDSLRRGVQHVRARVVTFRDVSLCCSEWARVMGYHVNWLSGLMNRGGNPVLHLERALGDRDLAALLAAAGITAGAVEGDAQACPS